MKILLDDMGTINLEKLKNGLPFISKIMGAFMMEAVIYCLTKQGHVSGSALKITGDWEKEFIIEWDYLLNANSLKSWNDWKEATEYAAMGITVLAMMELTKFCTFERAAQDAGVDFWLTDTDKKENARLEVSGIWKETKSNSINMRINLKRKQLKPTKDSSYISVVEFGTPKAKIIKR